MGVGERLEEDAFKDTEDHRVCANTGGQGDQRDGSEERGAAEPAEELFDGGGDGFHWA